MDLSLLTLLNIVCALVTVVLFTIMKRDLSRTSAHGGDAGSRISTASLSTPINARKYRRWSNCPTTDYSDVEEPIFEEKSTFMRQNEQNDVFLEQEAARAMLLELNNPAILPQANLEEISTAMNIVSESITEKLVILEELISEAHLIPSNKNTTENENDENNYSGVGKEKEETQVEAIQMVAAQFASVLTCLSENPSALNK